LTESSECQSSSRERVDFYVFISDWLPKPFVFGFSIHDHVLKVCEHDILQTTWGNFAKFTCKVHYITLHSSFFVVAFSKKNFQEPL